ncbi:MAG: metal-dependent hydrolase [Acidobacteriota bacterium]
MPLPVAHSLVGASIVTLAMRRLEWRLDWGPILTGALLGALPDLDLILSWGLGRGLHYHGSYTHSLLFALAAGAAAALIRREEQPRAVLGYIFAALSHGLLDALTKDQFGGAALLWPLSTTQFRFGLLPNYEFYPNPPLQGWLRVVRDAVPHLWRELKLYLPVFLMVAAYRYNFTVYTRFDPVARPVVKRSEKSGRQGSQRI